MDISSNVEAHDGVSVRYYDMTKEKTQQSFPPDKGQYLPTLTSPTIPFLGDVLPPVPKNPLLNTDMKEPDQPLTPSANILSGFQLSSSELPASVISQAEVQQKTP
jgi:hypothetical protein